MGAVPKHKVSRHQRGNRRRNQLLRTPDLTRCKNCGDLMQQHRACKTCGQYRGRQILAVKNHDADDE